MRLINTKTMELEQFATHNSVPFAILSHTWAEEEVTFQNFQQPHAQEMAGYKKILGCCQQAAFDGFDHIWIDTCCIDKSSSSELPEAINSMYLLYTTSSTCYAYLADVSSKDTQKDIVESFAQSRWFTRGWTLQELIAPDTVVFYTKEWEELWS